MKQNISAMMDGELFEDEAESLLDSLKKNPGQNSEWITYHLIGDALRQPDHVCRDISAAFHDRLLAEPTVFAPRRQIKQKIKSFAFSAAASVMALALVAWMSMQVGSEPAPKVATVQFQSDIKQAAYSATTNGVNDYVMAHQEFSPSTNVQGAATYIHYVADR